MLDAAAVTREQGDTFGFAQVAARAGVHPSSINRRWGKREALVVDAVPTRIGEEIPIPDIGSLRGDLATLLARSAAFLTSSAGTQLVRATAPAPHTAKADPRHGYWPRRLTRIGQIFERAIARGEISPAADVGLASEMLLAPLYFRLLITDAPLDGDLLERLTDMILRSLEINAGGQLAGACR